VGGSPVGAVIGTITLSLVGSVLTFLNVPSVWQIRAHSAILILVLMGSRPYGRAPDMIRSRSIRIDPAFYGFVAAAILWALTVVFAGAGAATKR
jgi:hypothetical protein